MRQRILTTAKLFTRYEEGSRINTQLYENTRRFFGAEMAEDIPVLNNIIVVGDR